MQDLVVFKFLAPFFVVLWLAIPLLGTAWDTKNVVQLAAREAGRKAAVMNDEAQVRNRALTTIQGSGKPISANGVTLFDPNTDVSVNFFDGERVTVDVHYRLYFLSPNILTIIGGNPIGPTTDVHAIATFEREW